MWWEQSVGAAIYQFIRNHVRPHAYRDTSLRTNLSPLETYSRTMPRVLCWSWGGGQFLRARCPCSVGRGLQGFGVCDLGFRVWWLILEVHNHVRVTGRAKLLQRAQANAREREVERKGHVGLEATRVHPGPFVGVSQSQFFRDVVNFWR